MSDCPDCENVAFTWEFQESAADELKGTWYRLKCRNWRHHPGRPTLNDISRSLRNPELEENL